MSSSALSYQDGNELEPKELIPQLCRLFYGLGWVTGSGGGISIRKGDQIFIAPSGVQKECIQPEDLFIQNIEGEDLLVPPPSKKLKKSQCTPLFMCAYRLRNAQAVIHSHSKSAVLATLISAENEFRCTHLEMIKVKQNSYYLGILYNLEKNRNLTFNISPSLKYKRKCTPNSI
ncbi:Hypothetical predicted protein [Cloeon dipterum]|uniref:Class II aldolase/adducin N-terminal domain-containing protein n=1 Tax=Cloeon dipterum TaxID=197152 RepID=A0A8S1D500_9INSE|nr:Hypothetical predicted protein [Cloeon dipterum]